jgi:hypothetical protein
MRENVIHARGCEEVLLKMPDSKLVKNVVKLACEETSRLRKADSPSL